MTDLDARVAAIMHMIDAYVGDITLEKFEALKQAILAEIQKPALHEPVTDTEVTRAIGVYLENRRAPYIRGVSPYTADIRAVLESFLQRRSKPERSCTCQILLERAVRNALLGRFCVMSYSAACTDIDAAIRASKGEKT